jgi:CheY-like chemotaxis protein
MVNSKIDSARNPQILVVEDDPVNQMMMRIFLQQWGFPAHFTENGIIAICHLRKSHYDLILMDIDMPVMNGYQATWYIRNKMKLGIPVIAVTANNEQDVRQKAFESGMNDFVTKPFEPEDLRSLIIQYLRK